MESAANAKSCLPADCVQQTIDHVIQLLKEKELPSAESTEKRRLKIISTIEERFNFPLMAKLTLGDTWGIITAEEQHTFTMLFSELLRRNYGRRIESFSDEEITVTGNEIQNDLVKVDSLVIGKDRKIKLTYRLKQEDADWLIYDIIIEGVSIVKQYRRQFKEIINNENFAGLLLRLDEKVKVAQEIQE